MIIDFILAVFAGIVTQSFFVFLILVCRQPLAQPRHRGRTASDLEATGPSHPDMDLDARTDVRFRVLGVLR